VAAFLDRLKATVPAVSASPDATERTGGRLIFALDATASRQKTWDAACRVQGEMFEATAAIGGLAAQLVFYRGFEECKASKWVRSPRELHRIMQTVSCAGGLTQIWRVLDHAIRETAKEPVNALIFVGDAMEEEVDQLYYKSKELGRLGVPIFLFQEGDGDVVANTYKQMADYSKGAYLRFDLSSIQHLKDLLGMVAVYATGNRVALENYAAKKGAEVLRLTAQLKH
jgi:hypothetical protein